MTCCWRTGHEAPEENLLFSGQVLEAHDKAGPVAVISSNYQQSPVTI
jgi:hypothetical protein